MPDSPAADGSRPVLICIAGPNGAGKSTFYRSHLHRAGLRFVNADEIARELGLAAYEAARVADVVRRELVRQRESFVFETVIADPVGEKLRFLSEAEEAGYRVVLVFIGLANAETSEQRVAMRVTQGGHDVPPEKLVGRFPRTLANLRRALQSLEEVWVFDHSDLAHPFRRVAVIRRGQPAFLAEEQPEWFQACRV